MAKKTLESISAFFPCYNDAGSIGLLVKETYGVLKKRGGKFEIIVIDDGSKDESRRILKQLLPEIPNLKLILHKKNEGYGGAIKSGFKTASCDLIFYTDGDGQYDPKDLNKLLKKLNKNVDVVQGYKIKRNDPWYRILIGKIYHYFSILLFGLKISDVDCDFRLIRKKAMSLFELEYNSGVICVELVKKLQDANCRFVEVGVKHYPRLYGHSQIFNYKRILKTIYEFFELRIKLYLSFVNEFQK